MVILDGLEIIFDWKHNFAAETRLFYYFDQFVEIYFLSVEDTGTLIIKNLET